MPTATNNNPRPELLDDFHQEFNEHYERCEHALLELEQQPDNGDRINELFRSVHTIKGNLFYLGLQPLAPLLQSVEDILDEIRQQRLNYTDCFSDIVLLALEQTRHLILENLASGADITLPDNFDPLCAAVRQIASAPAEQRQAATTNALRLLQPQHSLAAAEPGLAHNEFLQTAINLGVAVCDDIRFINNLVPALELRSGFWQGKTRRSALLALQINAQGNGLVPAEQLLMAALFHDLGMSFLPLQILHKNGRLDVDERLTMENHVYSGGHLLGNMRGWEQAMEMVVQHHERCDGSGYPEAINGERICHGAKILAITDTFDACRYARAYRTEQQRPLMRAIAEINRLCGVEFDEYWVAAFNRVVKQHFTSQQ